MSVAGNRKRTFMDSNSNPKQPKKVSTKLKYYVDKISLPWIERSLSRWNIAQKFAYSYALALGIAIVGTGVGLILGDYYERQAFAALTLTDKQEHYLDNVKTAVLEMRLHPQKLLPTFGKTIFFDLERARFSLYVNRVEKNLADLDRFLQNNSHHLSITPEELREIREDIQGYEKTTENYRSAIAGLWRQLDFANLNPEEIASGRLQLLAFMSSPSYLKLEMRFNRLAEDIEQTSLATEIQQNRATQNLNNIRKVRLFIIVGSVGLSAAIAAFLALLTSRAIALPLIAVKNIAQQVTQESNFNLRAPVTTTDEISALAISLNQLIEWMSEYTRELQQTQAQLIHSEKMSSLGQMVAGIAHEINNPASFIHGNIQYLDDYMQNLLTLIQHYQREYPQPTDAILSQIEEIDLEFLVGDFPKILLSMKEGTYRIKSIVTSLRNFSRLDESEMKAVDLHAGLESTLIVLQHYLGDRIKISKYYQDLPLVECYPAQLNQVFLHLLTNATDALKDPLILSSQKQPQIIIQTEKIDSTQVKITISDNGIGIPSDIQGKLFDPFFTTKPVGQGTGLGLSIVYKIVEKHQGIIKVNSIKGEGTQVELILPIHRDRDNNVALREYTRKTQEKSG